MTSFGTLKKETIDLISELMGKGVFHVNPCPASWIGEHVFQAEVVHSQAGDGCIRLQCWLLDPNLPQNMFSLEKRKREDHHDVLRICECFVNIPSACLHKMIPGDRFVCKAMLAFHDDMRIASVADTQDIWVVSKFDASKPIKFVHLFCGAFHGWSQAVRFLSERCGFFACGKRVSVDWDGNVCTLAADNMRAKLVLPPWRELDCLIDSDVVIACDVKLPTWLKAVQHDSNVVWTISFPCPPFSRAKGKGPGLDHVDGQAILHTLAHARKAQPIMLLLENVDSFFDHKHARLVFAFAKWAGYSIIWMQKHDLASLTNAARARWIAAMTRNDLNVELFEHVFQPHVRSGECVPWNSPKFQFAIPDSLADMLRLDESLLDIYGDPLLLPSGKQGEEVKTQIDALSARISNPTMPLATLVACYSKQHELPLHSLASKGLFAELVQQGSEFYFHSPIMWSALMGNLASLLMPDTLPAMFQQIGNAIAVPHALMACLAAFQAVGIVPSHIDLDEIVVSCWEERLDATRSLCVQTSKGFAVVTPGDFLLVCQVDRIGMLSQHGSFEGQCHVTWPDQVTTVVGYHVGRPLEHLMKLLGFPSHVMHLWGFLSHTRNQVLFATNILDLTHEHGQFVFLPMMPPNEHEITISDVSSTMEWTELPSSSTRLDPPLDSLEAQIHASGDEVCVTLIMPDMSTHVLKAPGSVTFCEALTKASGPTVDFTKAELRYGEITVSWNATIGWYDQASLVVEGIPLVDHCVLEITMLDGSTKFAPAILTDTIHDALISLNFHPQFVQRLRAMHNGTMVSMHTCIKQLGYPHIRLVCFPLKGGGGAKGGKGEGKSKGKTTTDPFLTNDPWMPKAQTNACRWDQLVLASEHPIFDKANDKRLEQVPLLQIGPQKGGVAFATRSAIPSLAEVSPPTTTVILIPGFRGLQGVDIPLNVKQMSPQQVIVQEPQSGTKYKRLVIPLVIGGEAVFKLQEAGAIAVTSTKYSELVIEAHPSLLSPSTEQCLQDQPLEAFKRLVASSGISMQEISVYSYRKLRGSDNNGMHQAIIKAPAAKTGELLKFSGKQELFIRKYLLTDEVPEHSLLPRYWGIDTEECRKAYQLGHSLGSSFVGLAVTPKGLCIRAANTDLAAARQLILQGDVRFSDSNRHVVCRYTYTAQGYPFAVSHQCVIEATHKGCGQPCVPLRSFRAGGLHTWVLGFGDHPKLLVFSVKVDEELYEVMLSLQPNIKSFKPNNKQSKPKTQTKANPTNAAIGGPVSSQINFNQNDSNYQALESRVSRLETQQNALTEKVDCGFTKMSNQLQMVLEAVGASASSGQPSKARPHESTGDTPLPKKSALTK
eukprot:Skav226145  [mRNA]  locus=scaffold1065:114686:118699:+ [translate_table: standard]